MKKTKILICSIDNENYKNFHPLIEKYSDDFEFDLLDLSNFHKNKIEYSSKIKKIIYSKISMKSPFYLQGIIKKTFHSFLFKKEVKMIKSKYDSIICGRVGILEYILINHCKKNHNAKAFSINDSILIYHEQSSFFKKIRLAIYGFRVRQNICDKIFVSGEISKKTLINDGVCNKKIIITGLPRFKKYFIKDKKVNRKSNLQNVLILTGAHKWNGYNQWQEDQETFLRKMNQLSLEKYKINIKPHPRDTFDFNTLNNLNILSKKSDIDKEIMNNDIVLCATSISTGIIQAGLLSKKILFIRTRDLSYIMKSFTYFISKFSTVNFEDFNINSLLKAEIPNRDILNEYISKNSLDSEKTIVHEIIK